MGQGCAVVRAVPGLWPTGRHRPAGVDDGSCIVQRYRAAVRLTLMSMRRIAGLWAAVLLFSPLALAQDAIGDSRFVVGDIRVEGLQRVSEGTVYNYLPVNIGDELNP